MLKRTLPIHQFAREGNLSGLLTELARGVSVDTRQPSDNRTPLMVVVSDFAAPENLVRLLLEKGADVNATASEDDAAGTLSLIKENLPHFQTLIDQLPPDDPVRKKLQEAGALVGQFSSRPRSRETALSIALRAGNLKIIQLLLAAGADVGYRCPAGYDALIHVMCGRDIAHDPNLVPIVKLLIQHGAPLNGTSAWGESSLRIASREGRFDVVQILLDAGSDPGPLEWTPLMRTVALGSVDDVQNELRNTPDLSARDFWSRTPWLLSLQTGDIAKAKLLLVAGASRDDRGRCDRPPLMYPTINGHEEMLAWLLAQGLSPNVQDEFQNTPLMQAAETGQAGSVRLLLDAGADLHYCVQGSESPIKRASTPAVVRLLISRGADLNDIDSDIRAALTHQPNDGIIRASRDEYLAGRHRRFGTSNPEKMNIPFWNAMISSGATASVAHELFEDSPFASSSQQPVWCFHRFGKSINELPDGRIIEIGGEHEDYYDPDFCIYNDVVVHYGDGTFDVYGYPKEIFPPTDFHAAVLVDRTIYIIGSLGYSGERKFGQVQVLRLDTRTLAMEPVPTSGEVPGWISRCRGRLLEGGRILIQGGKIAVMDGGREHYVENSAEFILDLKTLMWSKRPNAGSPPCQPLA